MRKLNGDNKTLKELLDECDAYFNFNQNIDPRHVKDMLRKAFQEGFESRIAYAGKLPVPPERNY